jgi:flagellar basal body-associated protein FliL
MADIDFGIKDKDGGGNEQKKMLVRIGIIAGVVVVFGLVGFGLGKLLKPGPQEAVADGAEAREQEAIDNSEVLEQIENSEEYAYKELEAITVTLNERRGNRYLRCTMLLKIKKPDEKVVNTMLEKNKAEIQDWLLRYLSSLTVSDVLGQKNINRVRRRIGDEMNELLWPQGRPRIVEVLLKEFNVS